MYQQLNNYDYALANSSPASDSLDRYDNLSVLLQFVIYVTIYHM